MLLGLLRHGETEGGPRFRGHTDDPLTAKGIAQMDAAIAASDHWDRVFSSPLVRCSAFACTFARHYSLPLTLDTRLQEMHFGRWEGRTAAELMVQDKTALTDFWNAPENHPPPDGESLAQFQRRVLDAYSDILAAHADQRVLIVTHGGVIRVLLCHILNVPMSQWYTFEVAHGQLHRQHIRGDRPTSPACIEDTRR